ncbi:hypothetical protein KHA93_05920 [Bacillus sp. FJAT-49732]|uniref:Uncharacterized protein n=1 Tax=Lederbergia citrisecunda TaxID=2833583 RepID=A0A942YMC3_9BACI|nr:DUF6241 domain-containing protein [Lederbergia citrisecunda]MBS4199191.1 hypothetical protein [Lederbergia citrisecunda]
MIKKIMWGLGILVAGFFIYFGYTIYKDMSTIAEERENPVIEDEVITDENITDEDIEITETEKNPFGQSLSIEEVEDDDILRYIHLMSHQKVKSQEKWGGFYLITDERIDWLIEAVELDNMKLKYKKVYFDILERWKKGDFSRIDKDHNVVWGFQGGNVGAAEGIMDPEEEKAFIESQSEE